MFPVDIPLGSLGHDIFSMSTTYAGLISTEETSECGAEGTAVVMDIHERVDRETSVQFSTLAYYLSSDVDYSFSLSVTSSNPLVVLSVSVIRLSITGQPIQRFRAENVINTNKRFATSESCTSIEVIATPPEDTRYYVMVGAAFAPAGSQIKVHSFRINKVQEQQLS